MSFPMFKVRKKHRLVKIHSIILRDELVKLEITMKTIS